MMNIYLLPMENINKAGNHAHSISTGDCCMVYVDTTQYLRAFSLFSAEFRYIKPFPQCFQFEQ